MTTSELFQYLRTTEDKNKLIEELDLLVSSLYKEKGQGIEACLKYNTRAWVAEIIRREIPQDLDKIESYLKKIIQEISDLKIVEVTLGYQPTEDSLNKFAEKIRNLKGQTTLLSISYNPQILAGAVITYEGEYRDFSLRHAFDAEYKAKEKEIKEIINSK